MIWPDWMSVCPTCGGTGVVCRPADVTGGTSIYVVASAGAGPVFYVHDVVAEDLFPSVPVPRRGPVTGAEIPWRAAAPTTRWERGRPRRRLLSRGGRPARHSSWYTRRREETKA